MSTHTHDCIRRDKAIHPRGAAPRHKITHIPGQRVVCACGWATPQPVFNAITGARFAERHLDQVRR